jgi:hypothetical protein
MMSMMRLIVVTLLAIFLCCACASQNQSGPPAVIYPNPMDVPLDQRAPTR